ncbi:hypothetical protein DB42_BR00100 [Neochlamydia sp. EPS4]|nr:hypothetical protein DB42_BR00100 [Neochlamydia sp. EPS4]
MRLVQQKKAFGRRFFVLKKHDNVRFKYMDIDLPWEAEFTEFGIS